MKTHRCHSSVFLRHRRLPLGRWLGVLWGCLLLVVGGLPSAAAAGEEAASFAEVVGEARPRLLQARLTRDGGGYVLSLLYLEEGENLCFCINLSVDAPGKLPRSGTVVILNPSRESYVREWVVPQVDAPLVLREVITRWQDADSAQLRFSAVGAGEAPAACPVAVDAEALRGGESTLWLAFELELSVHYESSSTQLLPRPGQSPLESSCGVQGGCMPAGRFCWQERIAFCPAGDAEGS